MVLEHGNLSVYRDETQLELLSVAKIDENYLVEAVPAERGQDNVFVVHDPDKAASSLLFAAPDWGSLEAWMIAFIQTSR